MIPVSMSRKDQSFKQLVDYMSSEKSDRKFDIHQNYFSRDSDGIVNAFKNNVTLLRKRSDWNLFYHEIISINLEKEVDRKHAKECLREIALEYIQNRCSQNLVYGCIHEDHEEHLHYHLMISANALGESKRHYLTKAEFAQVKRDVEGFTLERCLLYTSDAADE